jgi:hypothetical protein
MADEKSPLDAASERIRETAKWLTVSLAALGGVLVAGSQLSDIGSLELWSSRFWTAVVGAGLAAAGSGIILVATINTAASPVVTLKELAAKTPKGAEAAVRDETLLEGYPSVAALRSAYSKAIERRKQTYNAHLKDTADAAARSAFATADARAVALNTVSRTLVAVAAYRELARLWRLARITIVCGGVIAALGVGVFAWAANPPDKVVASSAEPAVLATPEKAQITLTAAGREALRTQLGASCVLTLPITSLKLGSTDAGPDALIQQDGCTSIRFVLVAAWGSIA